MDTHIKKIKRVVLLLKQKKIDAKQVELLVVIKEAHEQILEEIVKEVQEVVQEQVEIVLTFKKLIIN